METSRRGNSLFFSQTNSQPDGGWPAECVNMRGVCWYEMAATTPTHRNGTGRIQHGALKQVTLRKEEKLVKRELKIFKAMFEFFQAKKFKGEQE